MKIRTILVLFLGGLLGIVAAPSRSQKNIDQLLERDAMALMRLIGTSEATAALSPARQFLPLDELLAQQHQLSNIHLKDGSTGTVKNYQISVMVSADRRHYAAQLTSESNCDFAVFSNDDAIIYTAAAFGCGGEKYLQHQQ